MMMGARLLSAFIAAISFLSTPAFAAFPITADNPSPVSGAVTLTASPNPTNPVGVQFLLDGYVLEQEVTAEPYRIVWSAASAANGSHTITARARYSSGTLVDSDPLPLVVLNPATFHTTYYVDGAAGDDTADGLTPATAWKTLGMANGAVVAGDTVLLRGTFTGQAIEPGLSGTAAMPITFKSYPGETAVLSGGLFGSAVSFTGLGYIIVDGIRLTGDIGFEAVRWAGGTHHVVLRNCTLDTDSGIFLNLASDNVIENNVIRDVGSEASNGSDSFFVGNGSNRNRILYNTLTNGGHSTGLIGGGFSDDAYSLDNVVAHNVFDNPWAQPLILQWRAERTLVEHNVMKNGGTSPASVAGSRNGIEIYASRNIVRYNLLYNNKWSGIQLQAFTGLGLNMESHGNEIYHNVFHNNGDNSGSAYAINLQESDGQTVRNNKIYNNIFFENEPNDSGGNKSQIGILTDWFEGNFQGNEFRNNIVLRVAGESGRVVVHQPNVSPERTYTLSEFENTWSGVSGNFEANPLFTDKTNHIYTLQPGSPAIDAGRVITGYLFNGAAPDIGAFEFGDGGPPGPIAGASSSGGCFIATAAFGSPLATEVETLRAFRDRYLVGHPSGAWVVAAYYWLSPPVAELIRQHEALRRTTRGLLWPVIWWAHLALASPAVALALAGGGIVTAPLLLSLLLQVRRAPGPPRGPGATGPPGDPAHKDLPDSMRVAAEDRENSWGGRPGGKDGLGGDRPRRRS